MRMLNLLRSVDPLGTEENGPFWGAISEVCGKILMGRPHRMCPRVLPAGLLSRNPGALSKSKICRILPKTPPIFMRQVRADHRRNVTFSQIKPTKINLSLFGR